jgi:hypothetical protein
MLALLNLCVPVFLSIGGLSAYKQREMPSLLTFQRRAMEDIVYKSNARQEREEMEVALGLQQLGDGVVYTMVRGIPAPTAIPAAGRMPVMEELPRRVSGMHPTALARETISQGLYTSTTEYILPKQVPDRLVPVIQAASALCKIKKGLDYYMNKIKSLKKK